jgi:cytochrome bd ubiquinol oxidase subunit II
VFVYQRRGLWGNAFAASSLFIVGLLTTMAAGLYPNVLPAHDDRPFSLTVHNAASGDTALTTALFWWPVGMLLAAAYFVYAYRLFFRGPRKPTVESP